MKLFVPGRICLFGEHSDWAGGYRRINADIEGAHLRWFIVTDALRGTGMGARLLDTAIAYCHKRSYSRVYLHTFEGLDAARRLYERSGFALVTQTKGAQWGTEVNEQKFVLEL